ncbi:protein of unknown function [uncultured Woeseiaceae bacterium]|uniref:Uncharacterized protein n=1 Tax=uncultured Woeseiaceae bacterium TaxID=1983305 RepID=A0A7D9H5K6_9GAMM|nr:protein of unknown function [uncultured Woeseiaceae bacterium]
MGHSRDRRRCLGHGLICGRVPAPPAIALLVHLLDEFKEFAQIIGALRHIGGPDLLTAAMMGLVHEGDHGRAVGQRRMIDEAAEDMRAEHSLRTCFYLRPEALNEGRERRIGIRDRPRGVSRVVKHIAELGFEEDAAAIGEVARGLLRVSIGFKPALSQLDGRERRRGSHHGLLACRRMYFEMLYAVGYRKAGHMPAESRIVGGHD